ncbi:MAG: hypothetical protein GEV08_02795 [Acidimicrobiia bacterium]|nr:hypothetical protein [Acidimicrobiia bacterium]
MPFAAALSEHPEPAAAVGEAIGEVVERLGEGVRPDLAAVFVTAAHHDAFADVAAAVRDLLAPATLIGATAVAVVGGHREVEQRPGVSLWAAAGIGEVTPVRLDALPTSAGVVLGGLPPGTAEGGRALLLLPDPFTFPADGFVDHVSERYPGLTVIGGLASAASGPGGNLLALDDRVHADGAVAALLGPGAVVTTVVSQGCRPIGHPFTVTRAEGNLLHELGGRPAFERLRELAESLGPEERQLFAGGVHVGRVIDEHKVEFERGDLLVRAVLRADPGTGSLAVGDEVAVGQTIQFQVRDAASADEDLRLLLATEQDADAALLFTCNGRGEHFFGDPDHDATLVSELIGSPAVAGMFCAGEVGPVGGQTFLHGYTASVALFRDRP